MSVLTEMALKRVEALDRQLKTQREFIAFTQSELDAANEDFARWETERAEFVDFLAKQGIEPPAAPSDKEDVKL